MNGVLDLTPLLLTENIASTSVNTLDSLSPTKTQLPVCVSPIGIQQEHQLQLGLPFINKNPRASNYRLPVGEAISV
jgi:hypothetical protein